MKLSKICLKTAATLILCLCLSGQFCCEAQEVLCTQCEAAISQAQTGSKALPVPAGLSAINRTHTSICLSWTKPGNNVNIKGYQLYRDGRKIVTIKKNTYTNKNLVPGQQYIYTIKSYDASGNTSNSSEALIVSTVPDSQPPSAPGKPTASSLAYTTINLSWRAASDDIGIKRYEIYMSGAKKGTTTKTSFTCKGLSPGTTYSFMIKAFDLAGNSSSSESISIATKEDASSPSMPTGLKASSVTESEVALQWSPSTDNVKVKKYEVYCDGEIVGNPRKTSYVCKKLLPGQSMNYTVKAVDSSGLRSAASTSLRVTTLNDTLAPTKPTDLKVNSVKGSSVSLSWNASKDNVKLKGYKLYRNGLEVATSTRTTRTVKNSSFLGVGVYYVRAYDQSGNLSEKSNTVVVLTLK
ncbi:MAG: hypothetical protein GXY17_12945 [Clostridiaceae bacterium]|nr:hypothetical protein [Clostridiaceae bacterium]